MTSRLLAGLAGVLALTLPSLADEPLHVRIDRIVEEAAKKDGIAVSPLADDGEFLRRVWLDLAGKVPPADVTRAFLKDTSPD